MPTMTRESIYEYGLVTQFGGAPVPTPSIATLPHVDVAALTAGDEEPFYVTLQISEVGRVSKNGVIYDEELVSTIEHAIRDGGIQALMGHLPDDDLSTAYPHSDDSPTPLAGFWVGVLRVGEILWGKAYVPPGKVREYIRRLKATGGKLGVSFYGRAHVEEQEDGTRRLRDFELDTLDFAPHNRASLTLAGDFEVTSETENNHNQDNSEQGGDMPEPITLEQVPQAVREQIRQDVLRESQATENAQRVQELEQQVQQQTEQIAEMREYGRIVTEISAFVPEDADLVDYVREIHDMQMRIVEILGQDVNVVTRIEELHSSVAEMQQERFNHAVEAQVAELTDWQVKDESAQAKLDALRQNLTHQIVAQMGESQDTAQLETVAQQVWDANQVIAEAVRDSLAGPGAFVSGQNRQTPAWKPADDGQESRARLGL